jgi:hypothetical protein
MSNDNDKRIDLTLAVALAGLSLAVLLSVMMFYLHPVTW